MSENDGATLRQQIVQLLRESPGTYMSGNDICQRVGISRTALWKHIGTLREAGLPISARPRLGYAWSTRASSLARTRLIGNRVLHFMRVTSTNDVAKCLLKREDTVDGTVVIADEQTAGRGRLGRSWVSPRGGLWLSVVLRLPVERRDCAAVVGLLTSVATADAILQLTGIESTLKWPNDVMIGDCKVAGVLSELVLLPATDDGQSRHALVVGVGIDANFDDSQLPSDLMFRATTLRSVLGRDVPMSRLLAALLEHMERLYLDFVSGGPAPVLEKWRLKNQTLGRRLAIAVPNDVITGVASDVDEMGRLLLKQSDGQVMVVDVGDVLRQDPVRSLRMPETQS